ncbi:34200_t:CDS:2, partial [Racocetra persica]
TEKGLAYTPNWKEDICCSKGNSRNTSDYESPDSKEDENYLLKIEYEELYSYPTYQETNNINIIKTKSTNKKVSATKLMDKQDINLNNQKTVNYLSGINIDCIEVKLNKEISKPTSNKGS